MLLNKSFTGEALKTLDTQIETLIANDSYVQAVLENRVYKNIQISSNQTDGKVEVAETWTYTYYSNATKHCTGMQPNYSSSETVYFKKTANGWMVTSFTMGNEPVPNLLPCN